MFSDKEVLRKLWYNSDWDGTCGTCGASARWCRRYGNMDGMRRTYCCDLSIENPYNNNLIDKKSRPKWCPRMKRLKKLGLI